MKAPDRPLWLLAYLLFLFVYLGGSGPFVNEVHYLTKARHFWDRSWCRGDPFLESADMHVGFCLVAGWLTLFLSLDMAALLLRLASWILISLGWRRLAKVVGLDERDAFLAFALTVILVVTQNMAGEWFVGGVEGKPFAYGLVFYALAYFWQGRWNHAIAFAGLAILFHPVVGGWSAVGMAVTALLMRGWRTRARAAESGSAAASAGSPWSAGHARSLALGMGIAVTAAAIAIVPILWVQPEASAAERARAEQIHVFERLPHHLVLHQMAPLNRIRFAGGILVWFALAWWQRHQPATQPFHLFVASTLGLTAIGMAIDLATRHDPAEGARWLKFYWYRLSDVLIPMGITVGAFTAARQFSDRCLDGLRVAAMLLLPVVVASRFLEHRRDPRPAADRQGHFGLEGSLDDHLARYRDWKELCEWVRRHTAPTARFLTPTYSQTFKWYAQRPELVTWKDCPQDTAGVLQWQSLRNRVAALSLYGGLLRPRSQDWQQFAAAHGLQFIITLRELDVGVLALPHVYRNKSFDIYRVGSPER